jgi:hypothetical protein
MLPRALTWARLRVTAAFLAVALCTLAGPAEAPASPAGLPGAGVCLYGGDPWGPHARACRSFCRRGWADAVAPDEWSAPEPCDSLTPELRATARPVTSWRTRT